MNSSIPSRRSVSAHVARITTVTSSSVLTMPSAGWSRARSSSNSATTAARSSPSAASWSASARGVRTSDAPAARSNAVTRSKQSGDDQSEQAHGRILPTAASRVRSRASMCSASSSSRWS